MNPVSARSCKNMERPAGFDLHRISQKRSPNVRLIFICVRNAAKEDGSADLQYIEQAAASIGRYMQDDKLGVIKSTVPVGTNEKVAAWIADAQSSKVSFDVVSNPEFLREGKALYDALHPERIVIGSHQPEAARKVQRLYKGISCPMVLCSPVRRK